MITFLFYFFRPVALLDLVHWASAEEQLVKITY